jgi:hypothetical protein
VQLVVKVQLMSHLPRDCPSRKPEDMNILDFFFSPLHPRPGHFHPLHSPSFGSIRRECLDHVIVLHERHLRRLLTGYFQYDHHWRTHRALDMDCPVPRPVQRPDVGLIREVPEIGGCIIARSGERRDDTCAILPVDGCDEFSGPTGVCALFVLRGVGLFEQHTFQTNGVCAQTRRFGMFIACRAL